jgi:hypothetical protein
MQESPRKVSIVRDFETLSNAKKALSEEMNELNNKKKAVMR